jgi:hypothetical protein
MKLKPLAIILAAGSLALAQGPRGPRNDNAPSGSGLDMAKLQMIEGAVTAVNIGYGSQYPSIQIGQATIKVAPVWYFLENDFEIKTGDKLKVVAAPSLQSRDPYLSAISVTNLVSNAVLNLRDDAGQPLWTTRGRPNRAEPQGPGTCGGCGLSSVTVVSGIVDQVTAGAGIRMPSVVLKTSDGKLLTVKIGPERMLLAADFEIKVGESLTVKYGVNCEEENVALELTNAAGVKVALRNANGVPGWR